MKVLGLLEMEFDMLFQRGLRNDNPTLVERALQNGAQYCLSDSFVTMCYHHPELRAAVRANPPKACYRWCESASCELAAEFGDLEFLKWLVDMGGKLTSVDLCRDALLRRLAARGAPASEVEEARAWFAARDAYVPPEDFFLRPSRK